MLPYLLKQLVCDLFQLLSKYICTVPLLFKFWHVFMLKRQTLPCLTSVPGSFPSKPPCALPSKMFGKSLVHVHSLNNKSKFFETLLGNRWSSTCSYISCYLECCYCWSWMGYHNYGYLLDCHCCLYYNLFLRNLYNFHCWYSLIYYFCYYIYC